MRYARIVSNIAVDVTSESPYGVFISQVADEFQVVPADVENGWVLTGTTWAPPEVVEAPVITPVIQKPKPTPIEFKLCFSVTERIAIRALIETDPIIADIYTILDDPRLTSVDLDLQSTISLIDYLVTLGVISAERAESVKLGRII